jgi:peptide/nickel transport system permease protein
MLPLITSLAVSFACLFGGAPLMESIFNYPGIGSELTSRIGQRDFFVVQGIMIFTSTIVIIVNLITDSLYSLIDPRVRRDS